MKKYNCKKILFIFTQHIFHVVNYNINFRYFIQRYILNVNPKKLYIFPISNIYIYLIFLSSNVSSHSYKSNAFSTPCGKMAIGEIWRNFIFFQHPIYIYPIFLSSNVSSHSYILFLVRINRTLFPPPYGKNGY